ncbi:MAG: hypothetical protein WDA29_09900 [Flavobacteriaceae bacterium]
MIKLLIEQIVSEILKEDSYTEKDIPPYFFLVLPAKKAVSSGLLNYELKNFRNKGISDDKRILIMMSGEENRRSKDMFLIMPGKEAVANNSLTRFMYDNIDYWYSGNLKAAVRNIGIAKPTDSTYDNFMSLVQTASYGDDIIEFFDTFFNMVEDGNFGDDGAEILSQVKKIIPDKFSSLKHFHKVCVSLAQFIEKVAPHLAELYYISPDRIMQDLIIVHESIAEPHAFEGEWMVKNDTFNIPPSTKIILTNSAARSIGPKAIDSLNASYHHVGIINDEGQVKKLHKKWGEMDDPNQPMYTPARKRRRE